MVSLSHETSRNLVPKKKIKRKKRSEDKKAEMGSKVRSMKECRGLFGIEEVSSLITTT